MVWNKALDSGGLVVGDEVLIKLDIGVRQNRKATLLVSHGLRVCLVPPGSRSRRHTWRGISEQEI